MSAEHHAGKCVLAAVDSALAVRVQVGAPCNLRLHPHEHILADNGFVVAFYIVFRHLTVVGGTFLVQDADRVSLLQKGIADAYYEYARTNAQGYRAMLKNYVIELREMTKPTAELSAVARNYIRNESKKFIRNIAD